MDIAAVGDQLDLGYCLVCVAVFWDYEVDLEVVEVLGLEDECPVLVELLVVAVDILDFHGISTDLSQYRPIQIRLNRYPLENSLAKYRPKQLEKLPRKLLIQILIPLKLIHNIISMRNSEDARRVIKNFFDNHMNPLPEQSSRIINFLANKLYLNFLMHINFLILDKA